jgi:hypothetical protein
MHKAGVVSTQVTFVMQKTLETFKEFTRCLRQEKNMSGPKGIKETEGRKNRVIGIFSLPFSFNIIMMMKSRWVVHVVLLAGKLEKWKNVRTIGG